MSQPEQKCVRIFEMDELRITACAVAKIRNPKILETLSSTVLAGFINTDFQFVPNKKWLENPANERAWVKIYSNTISSSTTNCRIQTVSIEMPFFDHSAENCWGELQIRLKRPAQVIFGRNQSFDTRVMRWVPETKPIVPKKDLGSHGYLALRLYHRDYMTPMPSDWHWEPLYFSVYRQFFYRVWIVWHTGAFNIIIHLLDNDDPEIPEFLRK